MIFTGTCTLDENRIEDIARQVATLKERGVGVVLVVSGAVACGCAYIDISRDQTVSRQAAAGLGQVILNTVFQREFGRYQVLLAQVLLTKHDLSSALRRGQIAEVLAMHLKRGVIPFVNENDVVELNSFSGNDFLAKEVASMTHATKLVILSTMKGSPLGVGGGEAKQKAVEHARKLGIQTIIVDGTEKDILLKTI